MDLSLNGYSFRRQSSMTLIELLVVVAIIAILVSIASVNLLEAQIRARVARVRADLKVLGDALEHYRVDYPNYPKSIYAELDEKRIELGIFASLPSLTTPVAYLSSLPKDPFLGSNYQYFSAIILPGRITSFQEKYGDWVLFSVGPDKDINFNAFTGVLIPYDPTNGTISEGDIIRGQREPGQ